MKEERGLMNTELSNRTSTDENLKNEWFIKHFISRINFK